MMFSVVERKLTLLTHGYQRVKSFIKKVFRSLLHNACDEIDCEQSLIFFLFQFSDAKPQAREERSRVPQCSTEDVLATSSIL